MKREIHESFFQMEKEHNLFEIRTKDDIPVWDIVRYIIYYYLVFKDYKIHKPASVSSKIIAALYKSFYGFRSFLSFFKILYVSQDNFQYGVSRIKNTEGEFYDPYYDSIKEMLAGGSLLYDSVIDRKKYAKENRIFDVLPLIKNICRALRFHKKKNQELNTFSHDRILMALDHYFGTTVIGKSEIDSMLNDFRIELSFYKRLLKFKKIKRVFVTQNGIQKALFKAAKESNIPSFEFQHGDIVNSTILYNYQFPEFNQDGNIISPDVLFTFSNLWVKDKFIPANCVEIGTKFFNSKKILGTEERSITIITSNEQNSELEKLALDIALADGTLKIYYKLHPAQFHLSEQQKKYFSAASNIKVISQEKNMTEMMSISNEFIAIYSTAIFEVLQAGKTVYIYKKMNYTSFKSYFNIPNVYLVDSANDILKLRNDHQTISFEMNEEVPQFFKPFNENAFLNCVNNYAPFTHLK